MTKQILPFLFCFIRELNLYSPLTLTLRPPIRPYFKNLSFKKYFLMYYININVTVDTTR